MFCSLTPIDLGQVLSIHLTHSEQIAEKQKGEHNPCVLRTHDSTNESHAGTIEYFWYFGEILFLFFFFVSVFPSNIFRSKAKPFFSDSDCLIRNVCNCTVMFVNKYAWITNILFEKNELLSDSSENHIQKLSINFL